MTGVSPDLGTVLCPSAVVTAIRSLLSPLLLFLSLAPLSQRVCFIILPVAFGQIARLIKIDAGPGSK